MENEVIRLLKVITVLYLSSHSSSTKEHIFDEIKKTLSNIKVDPRSTRGLGSEEYMIEGLRDTSDWLLCTIDIKHNSEEIINRVRLNCMDNPEYLGIIEKLLPSEIDLDKLEARINSIMSELRYIGKREKITKTIQKANAIVSYSGEYVELNPFINEMIAELTDLNSTMSLEELPGLTGMVDFTDKESIKKALSKSVEMYSSDGMLNTGIIGLNEALGGSGLLRGWFYLVGAVSFGYKTGHLLDIGSNFPRFNKPWLWNPTRKPMMLRITTETTHDQDTKVLYQRTYYNSTGIKLPISKIDLDVATDYLMDYYAVNGYSFALLSFNPNRFTVFDLLKVFDYYEALGYEIHVCTFDYVTKIAKHTPAPREDLKLPMTCDIIRNYCYPKGILFCTGAQLNGEAKKVAQERSGTCTREFEGGSWYADSKNLFNELDVEILSNVHKHIDGKSYWCVSRGKHRDHDDTPMNKRDFYYELSKGGVTPDYGGVSRALYSLPNASDPKSLNLWKD